MIPRKCGGPNGSDPHAILVLASGDLHRIGPECGPLDRRRRSVQNQHSSDTCPKPDMPFHRSNRDAVRYSALT